MDILGASDFAIVEFGCLMTDAAQKVAEGGRALGTVSDTPQVRIASLEGVYPKEVDWRTLVAQQRTTKAAE